MLEEVISIFGNVTKHKYGNYLEGNMFAKISRVAMTTKGANFPYLKSRGIPQYIITVGTLPRRERFYCRVRNALIENNFEVSLIKSEFYFYRFERAQ